MSRDEAAREAILPTTTEPPESVDVLVVGYGPVGAALTALLGRHGLRVLSIDKADGILMAPRAIALDNEALRILQMVGLDEQAFARVVIPQVKLHSPLLGEFGRINTSGTIDGHPKLVTFYQPDLERALRQVAESFPGNRVLPGTELLGFTQQADGVEARLRLADGREHRLRARYLVGADGAGSMVRKAIGQDFEGKTYAEDWLIVDARDVPGDFDHIEFICDPRRPTPHMVAPGGRIRWEFMLQPGETREQMEQDDTIRRLLAPWARAETITIERKAVYRFHARSCKRYSSGRVFLVGDAAHITPPFVGQGLVAGLRDVANLAWKLAWVVHGRAEAAILDSYDLERRPHATQMIGLAKLMGRLVMPRNRAMALLVHGSLRLLRGIPGLRSYFDDLGVKPRNEFAQGLFVRGRARLRRGGQLPQARVRDAEGRVGLSDDALGDALTLVGLGGDAEARLGADTRQRWQAGGGRCVHVQAGDQPTAGALADLDGELLKAVAGRACCAVVRPDRTVLHDGPMQDAERIVRESLALLAGTAA